MWLDTSLTFTGMYRNASRQLTWIGMWGWTTLDIPNTEAHWLDTFISMRHTSWQHTWIGMWGWAILDIPNTETHWLDTSLTFISMYRHVSLQHTWVRMWGWATLVIPNTETHWLDTNLTFISMYRHAWNMIRHQPHIGNVQACIAAIHGLECEPDPPLTFPTLTLTD